MKILASGPHLGHALNVQGWPKLTRCVENVHQVALVLNIRQY